VLQPICYGCFGRTFDQCAEKLQHTQSIDFGQISENGLVPMAKAQCLAKVESLLAHINLVAQAQDTSFVLHIDEAHCWSVPFGFIRKYGDELVDKADYMHYFFIALTEVLEDLRAHLASVKIIISGTNVFLDVIIRFSSEFKMFPVPLGRIPPLVVLEILKCFLDMSCIGQRQQNRLAERIAYNGRSVQYFLHEVYRLPLDITSDAITYPRLAECVDRAYDRWLGIIVNHKHIRSLTENDKYTRLGELLLVFAYPAAVGAKLVAGGAVRFTPSSAFPKKWRDFAEAGAVRIQSTNNEYLDLYPLGGFLFRWATDHLSRKVNSDTLKFFMGYALSSSLDQIGAPGHFFEKAITAELTMPTSPLYKQFIRLIGGLPLRPDASIAMQPVKWEPRIQDFAGNLDGVYCVLDTNAQRKRVVDGAFPLLDQKDTRIPTWLDMKTSKDANKLWHYADDFFNKALPDGPRIFVSLRNFQDHKPKQQTGEIGTRSALDCYNSVQNKLKAVDANGRCKFAICDAAAVYNNCFMPISEVLKDLKPKDFDLYPGEENLPFCVVLEQLIPAVMAAKKDNKQRARIQSPSLMSRTSVYFLLYCVICLVCHKVHLFAKGWILIRSRAIYHVLYCNGQCK